MQTATPFHLRGGGHQLQSPHVICRFPRGNLVPPMDTQAPVGERSWWGAGVGKGHGDLKIF